MFRHAQPSNSAFGDDAITLTNGLFEFWCEFQIVLDCVIEPFADPTKLGLRQPAQLGFYLLDFAHEAIMQSAGGMDPSANIS